MQTGNGIFLLVITILYGLLVLCGALFFTKKELFSSTMYWLTVVTGIFHAFFIGTYTITTGHCLLTTAPEIFSLVAFTLLTTYLIVEVRPDTRFGATGLLVICVSFLFQLASSIGLWSQGASEPNPIFLAPSFNIHVAASVFGYAALTLSTIYGSLYLLLFRLIKKNNYGSLFNEVPSLSRLERYGVRALLVGFIFLSISILFGFLLIEKNFTASEASQYFTDPKTIATLLIWLVFGITLLLRKFARIEGRKLVLFWMSGYALTLLSMTVINSFVTEYHRFL